MTEGGRRGIYFFKPLPIPPPYKQHWERKIEEDDLFTKEFAIQTAAKEVSVEFSKCSHSESMFDEGSGICMSCGVFMGVCFAPLSANTSGIPGAHHHAFSSAATTFASRKKKNAAAAEAVAAGMVTFDSSSQHKMNLSYVGAPFREINNCDGVVAIPDTPTSSVTAFATTKSSSSSAAVFPLFYEGQKVVIFNGEVQVYSPLPFVFVKNKSLNTVSSSESRVVGSTVMASESSVAEQKRKAFISFMHQISTEAFGKMVPSLAGVYHPLDDVIATGIYSFTGYGFCRHSVCLVNSLSKTKDEMFTSHDLNKKIIDEIPYVISEEFEFFSSKRRRIHISLFVAIVTAHIKIVHGHNIKSIQECLDIQRLRAKVKASLISKETQSSFYHAAGARLGIDSKCSGRLVQDAYEMYVSKMTPVANSSASSAS